MSQSFESHYSRLMQSVLSSILYSLIKLIPGQSSCPFFRSSSRSHPRPSSSSLPLIFKTTTAGPPKTNTTAGIHPSPIVHITWSVLISLHHTLLPIALEQVELGVQVGLEHPVEHLLRLFSFHSLIHVPWYQMLDRTCVTASTKRSCSDDSS